MKLKINNKVTFAELPGTELHKYLLTTKNGEIAVLSGVTTMMKMMGVGTNYSFINKDVLARAAARGTAIHEMLQAYEMQGTASGNISFSWECEDGSRQSADEDCNKMLTAYSELSAQSFKPVAVEYLVSDNKSVASMIDFVSEVDGQTVDLIDYKSSSTLDKEALSWQLSFYKYLFEKQNKRISVRNLYGVHCHNEKVKVVSVPYKGDFTIKRTLDAFSKGRYDAPVEATTAVVIPTLAALMPEYPKITEALETKRQLQEAIDAIDAQYAEALAELKARMGEQHITEVEVPGGKYILTEEHTTTRFDSKKFKAAHPEEYDKYTTQSTTAASIKFYKAK